MCVADEHFACSAIVEVDGEFAAHGALDTLYLAIAMTWMAHAVTDVVAIDALEGVDGRTLRKHLLCCGSAGGCWPLAVGRWLVTIGVTTHAGADGGCLLVEGVVRPW